MGVSLKLQHVLDLWGLYSSEFQQRIMWVGMNHDIGPQLSVVK